MFTGLAPISKFATPEVRYIGGWGGSGVWEDYDQTRLDWSRRHYSCTSFGEIGSHILKDLECPPIDIVEPL